MAEDKKAEEEAARLLGLGPLGPGADSPFGASAPPTNTTDLSRETIVRETIIRPSAQGQSARQSERSSEQPTVSNPPKGAAEAPTNNKVVFGFCELWALAFGFPPADDLYHGAPVTPRMIAFMAVGAGFAILGPTWPLIKASFPRRWSVSFVRAASDFRYWLAALVLLFLVTAAPDLYRRATEPARPPTLPPASQSGPSQKPLAQPPAAALPGQAPGTAAPPGAPGPILAGPLSHNRAQGLRDRLEELTDVVRSAQNLPSITDLLPGGMTRRLLYVQTVQSRGLSEAIGRLKKYKSALLDLSHALDEKIKVENGKYANDLSRIVGVTNIEALGNALSDYILRLENLKAENEKRPQTPLSDTVVNDVLSGPVSRLEGEIGKFEAWSRGFITERSPKAIKEIEPFL